MLTSGPAPEDFVPGTEDDTGDDTRDDTRDDLEGYRRELTGYCYRMLGSAFEAEDAVQEAMVRAWRAFDRFEGRSSLRSWLYRIATNVCLDMLDGRSRRAQPMDLGPASPASVKLGAPRPEADWVQPAPDARVLPTGSDPAELAASRESVRLAFVAALQHLPPRQRAVLILCEVLQWKAAEAAELLDTSVAAVNSALQRARSTLAGLGPEVMSRPEPDPRQDELVARYVDAFERYDVTSLVALLHDDVVFNMPPFDLWLQGPDSVASWLLGPGIKCRASRLVPTAANGCPAFGSYRPGPDGGHDPFAIFVLEVAHGKIVRWHNFLGAELFAVFGLPPRLER